ncbi:MAG: CoA transferase [Acidimicrobiales bacterium]|nr:CoA transferase [Acidimicrobiales bacterium]
MFSDVRVLDCSDHRGHFAGYLLAALGAEVIDVEPPGGCPSRRRPPLAGGLSLEWWAYRRGRRRIGIAELPSFAVTADVVIDSGAPLEGGARPVDLAALREANPALVTVSISAFGSTGPKASWPASDLTIAAAAGTMAITGDEDRPPVRCSAPQAWLHAGGEAACGALLALEARRHSGLGQHVDISAQLALMQAAIPAGLLVPNGNPAVGRIAGGIAQGPFRLQFVYPAVDGHVSITLLFGSTIGRYTARLMRWLYEEGLIDATLRDLDWIEFGNALFVDPAAPAQLEAAKAAIASLTGTRTKAELFAEAQRRRLLLAPVATPAELVGSPQLAARRYWQDVQDPHWGLVRAPGPLAQFSSGQPPTLGPPSADAPPRRDPAPPVPDRPPAGVAAPAGPDAAPLHGLRVVDLTWVYAGPLTTRVLAEFGATVVKVEGPNRPDAARGGGGFLNATMDLESSVQFGSFNVDKLGLALDLTTQAGRAVLVDLARWADVLIESFTPGVMAEWGLAWEQLRAVNPALIMVSTSLMGQSGPLASFAGFGNLAGAVTGFYELTGWPDRSPAGPFLAYTDYLAPRLTVPAILAALDHRRRTGEGNHVDFAQAEGAIHFLAPTVLDHTVNGFDQSRLGNADRYLAPHGAYPCAGEDRWLAVACEHDGHWRALAGVLGRPDLAGLGPQQRLARRDELDGLVSAWTSTRPEADAEAALLAVGVPAHRVQNSAELLADPQLAAQGHFRTVPHPVHSTMVVEGPRIALSRTPANPRRAGPTLGEHTDLVLRSLLGYDEDRIAQLAIDGALG